jgi:hypothetical protein
VCFDINALISAVSIAAFNLARSKFSQTTAALPEVDKYIKNNGGTRIAGGFNKARLAEGKTPVGNRYVIIRWESMSAFDRAEDDGVRAWIEKNAPEARQIVVEGVEAK